MRIAKINITNKFLISFFVIVLCFGSFSFSHAASLADKLKGKILLQVESKGEAWYVYPANSQRYYLGKPADAFDIMRSLSLGISETNYKKFSLSNSALKNFSGRILLRVQAKGEAYYVNPVDLKLYYLGRPADAFAVMRNLGIGITNANLSQITISAQSKAVPASHVAAKQPNNVETVATQPDDSGVFSFFYLPKVSQNNVKGVNVAVCLMRWTKDIELPNAEYFKKFFAGVNDYYNEISLGKSYISNVQLAYPPQIWGEALPALFNEEDKIGVQMCDSLIDFTNVDVFIVFPSTVAGRGGASAEYMAPLETTEKNIDSRILIGHYDKTNGFYNHLTDDNYGRAVFIHEMGHTKLLSYLRHDSTLECGQESFGSNSCSSIEYGNDFSIMGGDSGHFSAWYKYLAGWLQKISVIQDGNYELGALEASSNIAQLLRVSFKDYPVCLEYRKPIGLDVAFTPDKMKVLGFSGGIPIDGCLFISVCTDKNYLNPSTTLQLAPSSSYLLDSTPGSQSEGWSSNMSVAQKANFWDMKDSCLLAGQKFQNGYLGLNVSFAKTDEDGVVSVDLDIDENKLQ